jgi:hypothetical protein
MQILKGIDMFGHTIGFEDNDSNKYKTWQGFLFTMIVIILCSVIGFLFGQEIYQRKDSNTRYSKSLVSNSTIDLNEIALHFITGHIEKGYFENPLDYLDIKVTINTINEKDEISSNYTSLVPCSKDSLTIYL